MPNKSDMPQGNTNGTERAFDLQLFNDDPAAEPATNPAPASDPTPDQQPTDQAPTPEGDPKPTDGDPEGGKPTNQPPDALADYAPTMPEGFEVDDALMGDFMTTAKELGINPEQADKMVGLGCQVAKNAVDKFVNGLNEQCQKNYTDFVQSQGKGVEQDIGNINALLEKYGGKEAPEAFHAALSALSAYGNDGMKPLFTALQKMGKDFADPEFHFGQSAPSLSAADVLYPKMKK